MRATKLQSHNAYLVDTGSGMADADRGFHFLDVMDRSMPGGDE
jgi:hypothetical protein